MSYTQSDLDSVKAAILALATGERVVRVTIGDKMIEYGQAQLNHLRTLRAEIATELQAASGNPRVIVLQTSKGL